MRWISIALSTAALLLSGQDVLAEGSDWYTMTDGKGTPFESRWAHVEPDWERSSAATMLAAAGINGEGGNLNLYIIHPRPTLEALTSEFTGTKDACKHDSWRLAVDRREFAIEETYPSTDNEATFIEGKRHPTSKHFGGGFQAAIGRLFVLSRFISGVFRSCGDLRTLGSQASISALPLSRPRL